MTQDILAKASRSGLRTIQRAERGLSIRGETAAFIADALAVPIVQLRAEEVRDADPSQQGDHLITLRRIRSGSTLVDILHRSYMCRIDCDVDADGSNVAALKTLASVIERRIPDPLSWEDSHLFSSLAERLDVIASLNDQLRELDSHEIGVFAGSYLEKVQRPIVSPYDPPSVRPGTLPTPVIFTRLIIAAGDREKLVVEKDFRWPVTIWDDEVPPWDPDLDDDVPF